MNLVLHVGSHGTETATFQAFLRQHRQIFQTSGVALVAKSYVVDNHDVYRSNYRHAYAAAKPTELRSLLAPFFELVRQSGSASSFLSDEDIMGPVPGSKPGFYPDASDRLKAVIDAAKAENVRVVLFVRAQHDLLDSSFCQRYTDGKPILLEEFLSISDIRQWSWAHLIERIERIVGANNIIVRPYEAVKLSGHQIEYNIVISKLFPQLPVLGFSTKIVASNLPRKAREIMFSARKENAPKELRELAQQLRPRKPVDETVLPEIFRQAIIAHHGPRNLDVFERFIPDLSPEALGYSVGSAAPLRTRKVG